MIQFHLYQICARNSQGRQGYRAAHTPVRSMVRREGVCSGNEVGMHGHWGLLARCYLLNCRRLSHGTTAVWHTTRHGAHMQHDAKGGRLLPAFGKYLGRAGKLGTRYNTQGSTNIESTILKRICQHLVISRVLASSVPTTSAADVATTEQTILMKSLLGPPSRPMNRSSLLPSFENTCSSLN